jgi:hypothetical protein
MFHRRSTPLLARACLIGVTAAAGFNICQSTTSMHLNNCYAFCDGKPNGQLMSPQSVQNISPKEIIMKKMHDIEDQLSHYRPDMTKYERIDHVIFEEENFKNTIEQHALYSSLHGESRIEAYEIYRSKETEEIYCIVKFGDKINGWPNIVHGGEYKDGCIA